MGRTRKLTLAWATDTHFDHAPPEALAAFGAQLRDSGAAALLLGGDVSVSEDVADCLTDLAERSGLDIYFVLGNHDYYGDSIAGVRRRIEALAHPGLHWLPATGRHELAPGISLVGVDGWGDARLGDFATSHGLLNDYDLIEDLAAVFDIDDFDGVFGPDSPLEKKLKQLGTAEAEALAPHLAEAAAAGGHVVVLTHVPPFEAACWHKGKVSSETWLPGFACGAVGDLVQETADAHPDCRFTVMCGHTHGKGTTRLTPNLVVHTNDARYEHPAFSLVRVGRREVEVGP